jgi:hypothetical protein
MFSSSSHSLVCWRWSPFPLELKKSLLPMTCWWLNNTTAVTDMAAMGDIHAIMDTDIRAAVTAMEGIMAVTTAATDTADPSKIKTLLNSVTVLMALIPHTVLTEDTEVIHAVTLVTRDTLPVITAVATDTINFDFY